MATYEAGPHVIKTFPSNYQSEVGLGSVVKINFDMDLDYDHAAGMILVTDGIGSPVPGVITYDYRTLIFTPQTVLAGHTNYQVVVLGDGILDGKSVSGVRNILGIPMRGHYKFTFSTGSALLAAPVLSTPTNQSVVREVPLTLRWSPVTGAAGYEVQVSRNSTILPLYWPVGESVIVAANEVIPITDFPDGFYWWRARAVDAGGGTGDWSDVATFSRESIMARPVVEEDTIPPDPAYDPVAEPIELIASYPEAKFSNVATNLAIVTMTLLGPVQTAQVTTETFKLWGEAVTMDQPETGAFVDFAKVEALPQADGSTLVIGHLTSGTTGAARKYGSTALLENNRRYTAQYYDGATILHEVEFTSRYTPLYAVAKDVDSDTGGLLSHLTPDQINYAIWLTSQEADAKLAEPRMSGSAINQYARKQYVRYRTEVDLVNAAYLSMVGEGNVTKQVGDFHVKRDFMLPKAQEMLSKLRTDLAAWEGRLFSGRVRPSSAVRAGNSAYPYTGRVGF